MKNFLYNSKINYLLIIFLMGNDADLSNYAKERYSINLFEFKYIIGRGGFGKVWKVKYRKTGHYFALKEMSKVKIIDRKSEKNIMLEKNILSTLHHPFIVNMIYSFQNRDYLYILLDYLQGGDMRYHLCREKHFTEEETKFFAACVLTGLEYIHKSKILHRDIKPENLVLDERGYLRITDFGVSKKYHKNNKEDTSGTPGYMAPEVLFSQNHAFPVDFYALGMVSYEFMMGKRPYEGKNRKDMKNIIMNKQAHIHSCEIPIGWTLDSADFINNLIQRKTSKRLGYNGIEEIKNHKWFDNFNWDDLFHKKINPPFVPNNGDNFDKKHCQEEKEVGNSTNDRYKNYKKDANYLNVFADYTCINIKDEDLEKYKIIKRKKKSNIYSKTLNSLTRQQMQGDINKLYLKGGSIKKMSHYKNFITNSITNYNNISNSLNNNISTNNSININNINTINNSNSHYRILNNNFNSSCNFFERGMSSNTNKPHIFINLNKCDNKNNINISNNNTFINKWGFGQGIIINNSQNFRNNNNSIYKDDKTLKRNLSYAKKNNCPKNFIPIDRKNNTKKNFIPLDRTNKKNVIFRRTINLPSVNHTNNNFFNNINLENNNNDNKDNNKQSFSLDKNKKRFDKTKYLLDNNYNNFYSPQNIMSKNASFKNNRLLMTNTNINRKKKVISMSPIIYINTNKHKP